MVCLKEQFVEMIKWQYNLMIKEQVKLLWKFCFDDSEVFIEFYFWFCYNNEVNLVI